MIGASPPQLFRASPPQLFRTCASPPQLFRASPPQLFRARPPQLFRTCASPPQLFRILLQVQKTLKTMLKSNILSVCIFLKRNFVVIVSYVTIFVRKHQRQPRDGRRRKGKH